MIELAEIIESSDPTIQVLKLHKEPYRYQVACLSKKATTKPSPQLYTVKIECNTEKLRPTSKIKAYCDCHDFRYRQAYCWYTKDALLLPPAFVLTPPNKTNPNCGKLRACKHISTSIHYILARNL